MATKIAINGLGRIGRPTLRKALENPNLEVVAVNDLTEPDVMAHFLKYDSVYGTYEKSVESSKDSIEVDGRGIKYLTEKDPLNLPWEELNVDVVLECTGVFRNLKGAEKHIKAGAQEVIISAPAKSEGVPSFVLGVNEEKFKPDQQEVVDMASCTTNCLAPVVKVLNDEFGVERGLMTTTHSYTTSQNLLDLPGKDLRRSRAAAVNLVPTTTGAAKAIGKVLPELDGKLDGMAIRVPTPTVSITDSVFTLKKKVSADKVNCAFKEASKTDRLNKILKVEENPLVSTDFRGSSFSAVVDALSTRANENMVKVLAWYDNEYGYACRLVDFAEYVGSKLN